MPPTCTLPCKNASTTAPTSYSKAPDSPFLRFSKATSCPGLLLGSPRSWEGWWGSPVCLFCKPPQGPGHLALIWGSYLG